MIAYKESDVLENLDEEEDEFPQPPKVIFFNFWTQNNISVRKRICPMESLAVIALMFMINWDRLMSQGKWILHPLYLKLFPFDFQPSVDFLYCMTKRWTIQYVPNTVYIPILDKYLLAQCLYQFNYTNGNVLTHKFLPTGLCLRARECDIGRRRHWRRKRQSEATNDWSASPFYKCASFCCCVIYVIGD